MKLFRENYNNWKIEFVYSPFFEMLCSLHVLYRPEHHLGRLEWAEKLKGNLKADLINNLSYFGKHYFEWCSAMDFCQINDKVNGLSVIEAIEVIEQLDVSKYIYIMLGEKIELTEIQRKLEGKKMKIPKSITDEQKVILREPEQIRMRFVSCLKEYYYTHFQQELRSIEPMLVRALKRHKIYSEKMDFLEYIKTIHSRIEISRGSFHFHKYTRFDVHFEDVEKLRIRISSFIDPHLLLGIFNSSTIQLTIRANTGGKKELEIPSDLFKIMKALADETRIKILKLIYKKSECTQNLAMELNFSEACISKHLKVLQEAGLISGQRKGNYIIYSINCIQIDKVPMDIYQYFDN